MTAEQVVEGAKKGKRRRGNNLEPWEVALVKAMLARQDRTDQDILAYFTRPTRSVNHRLIGQIRKGTAHKATPPATDEDLAEFLTTWPDIDPQTGLSLRGDELLIKAREAMIAAVHTFNGAGLYFRAELFIVTAIIAWTYLHHAYFRRLGVDYRYCKKVDGVEQVATLESGAERYWELGQCLKHAKCPLTKGMVANLEFLLGLRHEIEHRSTSRIDDAVSTQLQACCINFNEVIKAQFGPQYGLERRLPIALQFMTFSSDQRAVLKRAANLPRNIETMMDAFTGRMTPDEQLDPHFAFRVNFTPVLANRPAGADQVIEFSKATQQQAGTVAFIKEVDRRKYRPGQIVAKVKAAGYRRFTMQNHTDLWKAENAKDPKLGFGSPMYGNEGWGWNEKWLTRVLEHCRKYSERYGKRTKSSDEQSVA
ncbi:MAG: DUF3644 domain-containing protein [Chthoniobacter sp.]|nr:DUF3644 domain-containing protein [Chthoniobacter sp.]